METLTREREAHRIGVIEGRLEIYLEITGLLNDLRFEKGFSSYEVDKIITRINQVVII